MKLKLTYVLEEQETAAGLLAALLRRLPGAKVRRDKSQAPKLCVYVTIKERSMTNGTEKVKFDNAPGHPKDVKSHR